MTLTTLPLSIVLTACGGAPPAEPEPPKAEEPAPPPPAPGPAASAAVTLTGAGTEADPYQAACDTKAHFEGDAGKEIWATCPADCKTGSVWGSGTYTEDSTLCVAAIHSGAIPATGGKFSFALAAGQESYKGSAANGVKSSDWGSWGKSFTIASATEVATAPAGGAAKTDAKAADAKTAGVEKVAATETAKADDKDKKGDDKDKKGDGKGKKDDDKKGDGKGKKDDDKKGGGGGKKNK